MAHDTRVLISPAASRGSWRVGLPAVRIILIHIVVAGIEEITYIKIVTLIAF
jgi:hypothetical protein